MTVVLLPSLFPLPSLPPICLFTLAISTLGTGLAKLFMYFNKGKVFKFSRERMSEGRITTSRFVRANSRVIASNCITQSRGYIFISRNHLFNRPTESERERKRAKWGRLAGGRRAKTIREPEFNSTTRGKSGYDV